MEKNKIEYWCLYKVKDKNPFIQKDKKVVKIDYLQHWFAVKVSSEFRDYLLGQDCKKIKYGTFITENPKVSKGFEEVGKKIYETIETSLINSLRKAVKSKDHLKIKKFEQRLNFLRTDFQDKIKPEFLVIPIRRV